MKINSNIILLVLTAGIVASGAYWYFFVNSASEPPLSSTTPEQNQSQAQFQTLIAQLQPISFETTIFTDERFLSLVDLKTPVTDEPLGRPDPFAPIGATRVR